MTSAIVNHLRQSTVLASPAVLAARAQRGLSTPTMLSVTAVPVR
jgi:hypothetical protein